MKPLPNSLEYSVEESARVSSGNPGDQYSNDLPLNWKCEDESVEELYAEFSISGYPPHVRNILTQTVTHEEIRIYSGATVKCVGSLNSVDEQNTQVKHLLIKSTKRSNIDRAVAWLRRLVDQAMNLPKYKEKVLIGLENASPGFDVRGKVLGPGGANLQYITNETGAIVTLRGRGSGFIEPTTGLESIEPLHLCVEHNSKYEVLQAGRQLAFNLIETVQQEWYSYQQQHQTTTSSNPSGVQQNQQQLQQQTQQAAVSLQHTPASQHLHMPPPTHSAPPPHPQGGNSQLVAPPTTAVPPPMLTSAASVPPPSLVHQPPPPPGALQLAADLSQLVQAPPPHLQVNQPPPQLVQPPQSAGQAQQQLVQAAQPQQLVQQQQQLVQSQHQTAPQLLHQSPATAGLSLLQQGQPSILHAQQALSQGMLMPGTSVGPGQTVQVVQTSQLSAAAIQPSQAATLQEIPSAHVYSTAGGNGTGQVANILTQQVLPPGTSIIQQPHIISQASYPQLQYMQGGGGGMAVVYGAAGGGASTGREGVMLLQYGGGASAARRIQPQIVQLVHPGTGQVVGAAPLLLQGPSATPLLLQQQPSPATTAPAGLLLQQPPPTQHHHPPVSTATVLLQQPSSHHLQFTAQPQPIHIIPQSPHQTMMTMSSNGQVVTSGAQTSSAMVTSSQHGLISISPHQSTISPPMGRITVSTQGQKRRFEQDHTGSVQTSCVSGGVSMNEVSSLHKKGVGSEGSSPSKVVREQLGQSTTSSTIHSKLVLPASQSDEQDVVQISRVEMKPDSIKRGRTVHGDEGEASKEIKSEYTYTSGKLTYTQPPPQHTLAPTIQQQHTTPQLQQQHAASQLQQQQHALPQLQQGLLSTQLPPPPQFTAPPPHYPPQYYQQPSYQTYQPSWNHMHSNSNQ